MHRSDSGYKEHDERFIHVGYYCRYLGDPDWHISWGTELPPWREPGVDTIYDSPCDVTPIYVREVLAETDILKPQWIKPLGKPERETSDEYTVR